MGNNSHKARLFVAKEFRILGVQKERQHTKGFSLLELIISLGLLSLGFLFLSGLSITTVKVNAISQNRTAALQLAQEKIEAMKILSFDELRGEIETGLSAGSLETPFQRETVVKIEGAGKLADITIRVSWAGSGVPKTVHCSELFTRVAG